jgi:hypothetical protein
MVVADWKQNIKNSLNSINKSSTLKIDKQGNCYVLGTTWFPDSAKDIILIKINAEGDEEWRRTYDNPGHGDDIPTNMCLDPSGNIWVCGIAKTKADNADFLIVKFNPDGIPVADELFDGRDRLFDCASYIESDKFGNVFAVGYETTLDSGINMLLVKCRTDGSFSWKKTFASREMDVGNKLLVDDSCNVYICGTANNGMHTADILVQKYDSSGKKKWQLIYDGVLNQSDAGLHISADDSMFIYVSGFVNHSNNRADIPILKLTRNGQIVMETFYNGRIADCGGTFLNATNTAIFLASNCIDYNIGEQFTFVSKYEKSGNLRYAVNAPKDVHFINFLESNGSSLIFGSKKTFPESTLIPYIAMNDTSSIVWSYSDSTVYGLAHITNVEFKDNGVYFLGDDTGDATGTISIFKYILNPEIQKKKKPGKKIK